MADISFLQTSLFERAKNIMLNPTFEWELIEAETPTIRDIYKNYILPLAAIEPLAALIGASFVGFNVPFVGRYYVPLVPSLLQAVICYALTLLGLYVLARLIDYSTPRFGGDQDRLQAFKLAAYSYTPVWIFGLFNLIPELKGLSLLGLLYGLYLLYLGLPLLMRSDPQKRMSHTILAGFFFACLYASIALVRSLFFILPKTPG